MPSIIDPDGYFGGDRFDLMSDSARMAWPSFWCASNTVGRLELNYDKVRSRAFGRYKNPPTYEQFWAWVAEYRNAHLLFVYCSPDGRLWGQWDTSEKYLPRHKLTADVRTPAPNAREFVDWKAEYVEEKKARVAKSFSATNFENLRKVSQGCANLREVCGNVQGVGVGVGVGGGVVENHCPAAPDEQADDDPHALDFQDLDESAMDLEPPPLLDAQPPPAKAFDTRPKRRGPERPPSAWYERTHDEFYYQHYWNRVKKNESRARWESRVNQLHDKQGLAYDEAAEFLCRMADEDKTRSEHTRHWEWRQNLMPSTWLNGSRWQDELKGDATAKRAPPLGHQNPPGFDRAAQSALDNLPLEFRNESHRGECEESDGASSAPRGSGGLAPVLGSTG